MSGRIIIIQYFHLVATLIFFGYLSKGVVCFYFVRLIMSFPKLFDVTTLNGKNGFTLTSSTGYFGSTVAGAGDVNGDGKPDFIVGACYSSSQCSNTAYVVFGASNFPTTLPISSLNGNNGFTITGPSNFGLSVAGAGDIDGDGIDDLVIGTTNNANAAYIIYGSHTFPATLDMSALNGKNGFTLTSSNAGFGSSVAGAGDVNGDGKADLIVGSGFLPGFGSNTAYVIYGSNNFPTTLDTSSLNGNNGFQVTSSTNNFGWSVAGAGDVNGDGKADLILGSYISGSTLTSYLLFGANSFPSTLDTSSLNGSNGFAITSLSAGFGCPVSGAGDVNGDGKADLIIGTLGTMLNPSSNKAFVVFGASSFPSTLDTSSLNGKNGFTLTSSSTGFGSSVASASDINGDGKADIIIGTTENAAYVIYGSNNFPNMLDTSALNGANGFELTADMATVDFGSSVAGASDINGDGKPDLIIGAGTVSSEAWVVFGGGSSSSHDHDTGSTIGIAIGVSAAVAAVAAIGGAFVYAKYNSLWCFADGLAGETTPLVNGETA